MGNNEAPQRSRLKLPAFIIATVSASIVLLLIYAQYAANRPDHQAQALVLWEQSRTDESPSFDSRFFDSLLGDPTVRRLESLSGQPDPKSWIQSHVTIATTDNPDVFRLSVSGKSKQDTLADFVPLINATINSIVQTAGPSVRFTVLEEPHLIKL